MDGTDAYDQYASDPAKPVPYRASRPTLSQDAPDSTWGEWLVDDQRNAASRPDVLVYQTEPLKAPVRIAGAPLAELYASTTGSDADWVVKIIDVWPDEVPAQPRSAAINRCSRPTFSAGAIARISLIRIRLPPTRRCFIGFDCPMRVTPSFRATASWCRSNRAGSHYTTVIRSGSCQISCSRRRRITPSRRTASGTLLPRPVLSTFP